MSLDDKVVLITGAAHRVGAEVARFLHRRGARIVIHYNSSRDAATGLQTELEEQRPDSAALVQADLLDSACYRSVINEATGRWQRLDALINNASTFYPTPVGSITEDNWEDLVGTNLRAPTFLSQYAAPELKKRNGCIINIVDIHAEKPLKEHVVYNTAKAGLVMLTKSLARELAPEVRVNAVAPGAILWPENELSNQVKQDILSRIALKRQGSPQDIARAIAFLLEDAEYTTGHILNIDGGRSLHI